MRRLLTLTSLLLLGCDAGTGGELVTISVAVRPVMPGPLTLDDGRAVTLTTARLSFGPMYSFEQPPPTARRRGVLDWLIPSAHAHAGHDFFAGGQVVTEWIRPVVVDLLAGEHALGEAPAIAGPVRSFSVYLVPHRDLGASLELAGTVERGGAAVPFSLATSLGGAWEDQRVDFAPAQGALAPGARLEVEVRPQVWLRGARFEEATLEPLAADSQTVRVVQVNLKQARAWSASVVADPTSGGGAR